MDESDVDICQASNNTNVFREENGKFTDDLESGSGTEVIDQQKDGANDFESLTRPISAVSATSSVLEDSCFKSNLSEVVREDDTEPEPDPNATVPDFQPRISSPIIGSDQYLGFHEKRLKDIAAEISELDISQNTYAVDRGSRISDDELSNLSFPEVPLSDPGDFFDRSSIDGGSVSHASSHSLSKSYIYSSVSVGQDIPNLLQDDGDHLIPKYKGNGRGFCWPMDKLPLSGERKFEEGAEWKILDESKRIGYGASGQCFLGHPIVDQENIFCVKKCQYNEDEVKALCLAAKEIYAKKISEGAKKIVLFYGATYYKPNVCIFMEYMEGGTVHDAIIEANKQYKDGLDKINCVHYFKDVLLALEFIHRKGIVHNDVKANNVLLTASKLEAKLCDFGKAAAIDKHNLASRDVWKAGCFLLDMLGKKYSKALTSGFAKKTDVLDQLPDDIDQDTYQVLSMCFLADRNQCTTSYVLTSKFFKS